MKTLIDLGSNERWMASINSAGVLESPIVIRTISLVIAFRPSANTARTASRSDRRSQRQVYFLDTASRYSRVRTEEFTVLTQRSRCHDFA